MISKVFISICALSVVAACADTASLSGGDSSGDLKKVPEGVVAIAAPGQDLTAVRIMPEDGCYWYRYVGPVETTYLPLRTAEGSPICSRV